MASFLALALLVSLAPGQERAKNLDGYLLVSSDPALAVRARKEIIDAPCPYANLSKRFPAPRFEVRPWGEGYGIVVDLETGPMGIFHDRRVATEVMIGKSDADGLLRTADLTDAEAEALGSALFGIGSDPKTGRRILPSAFCVGFSTKATATNGGETRSAVRPDIGGKYKDAHKRLRAEMRQETADAKGSQSKKPRTIPEAPLRDSYTLTAIGHGKGLLDGMVQVEPLLREIVEAQRKLQTAQSAKLFAKLGYDSQPRFLGDLDKSGMPEDKWKAQSDWFASQYNSAPGGEAAARRFFDGGTVRFETYICVAQVFDPGSGGAYDPRNPSAFRPGRGSTIMLFSEPGLYEP